MDVIWKAFEHQGPLWAFFAVWLYFTLAYVPGLIESHVETVAALRDNLARLTVAYEKLAGRHSDEPPRPLFSDFD